MKVGRMVMRLTLPAVGMLVASGFSPMQLLAQDHAAHADGAPSQAGRAARIVREATERLRDVSIAENEGYGDGEGQPQRDACQLAP